MSEKKKLISITILSAVLIAVLLSLLFSKHFSKEQGQGDDAKSEVTETVEGIDADNNGIRDDVDAYIDENFENEPQNKAVRQLARSIQDSLLVNKLDGEAVGLVAHSKVKAFGCVYEHFDVVEANDYVIRDITSIVVNNNLRMKEYSDFNQVLDGVVLGIPSEGACEF